MLYIECTVWECTNSMHPHSTSSHSWTVLITECPIGIYKRTDFCRAAVFCRTDYRSILIKQLFIFILLSIIKVNINYCLYIFWCKFDYLIQTIVLNVLMLVCFIFRIWKRYYSRWYKKNNFFTFIENIWNGCHGWNGYQRR
jgi:hypothetical protein